MYEIETGQDDKQVFYNHISLTKTVSSNKNFFLPIYIYIIIDWPDFFFLIDYAFIVIFLCLIILTRPFIKANKFKLSIIL